MRPTVIRSRPQAKSVAARLLWWNLAGFCLVYGLVPAALAEQLTIRKVALTGEQAPGTEQGVFFSSFTTPLNHDIMHPVIDDQGRVAFIALLSGEGVDLTNQSGIWSEGAGSLDLVVRTGMHAPGTPQGVVFVGVPSEYLPFPPRMASGATAFQGVLGGPGITSANDHGVWTDASGQLALIARAGDAAAGAAGASFSSMALVGIDGAGRVTLTSQLAGAGVTSGDNEGVWADRSGSLQLVVREGDHAPGTEPGVVHGPGDIGAAYVFPVITFNDSAQVAIQGNLMGSGVDSFNDEALFLEQDGELTLVLREGDPAPGAGNGVTFGGNSVSLSLNAISLNDSGHVAFNCRLGGAIPTTTVAYSNHTGSLAPLIMPGDPAPGTAFEFSIFSTPVLNNADRIAVSAATPDDDNDPFTPPPFGIWWEQPGELTPLILPGDVLEHHDQVYTFIGSSGIVGYNAAGAIAFRGALEDGQGGYTSALMLADPAGDVQVIVGTGDQFDVEGDGTDVRQVLRIVAGGLSESGAVAFRLDFTDGTSGHFAAQSGATGDLDGNGIVDVGDLLALLAAWGPCADCPCPADVDGDCAVGVTDLLALLANWTM